MSKAPQGELGQRTLPPMLKHRIGWMEWVIACFLILTGAAAVIARLPRVRVGDGIEYYGLFFAWTATLRPWMSAAAFAAYQQFHAAGAVLGTLPSDVLHPALRVGATTDFNHFWLYSLLASVPHFLGRAVDLSISAHVSFLILHTVLFLALLAVAARCHGWKGFVTVLLLVLGSPIAWFANKVHTEFFTFCVTTIGVILAMRNQLIAGAVFMAIAATQNPGLSFVPVAMLLLRALADWKLSYSRWEVIGVVLTVVLLALHPAYYFARYDVISPQLLAGGATPGLHLNIWYIWLIDPDLGLFPNWPLGLLFLVMGAVLWRSSLGLRADHPEKVDHPIRLLIVGAIFFLACIYSHASTVNLNSGGTPGLARYALWYIPLVYPFALACVVAVSSWRLPAQIVSVTVALACTAAALIVTIRTVNESYQNPSLVSAFVQKHLPGLYDPDPEIFSERYSGLGEAALTKAVVGPDCVKILIFPGSPANAPITAPKKCPFVPAQLDKWVSEQIRTLQHPAYKRIHSNDPTVVGPPST